MKHFLYKNRYKFVMVFSLVLVVSLLTSCRFNAGTWYAKPYTTYSQDWIDLWDHGDVWNTLWAWPINLLSYPIAFLCSKIGHAFGNSYFWGIFFTTLIVRTLAWPIYSKQNSTNLKMQLMQPEMAKIQRKYQNRKDPQSQQQMQAEMAKLYKKYKMNPFGCMVTMFLQFPIFMSMYEVVKRINATTTTVVDGVEVTYAGKLALSNTKVFGVFEMDTSFFDATNVKDKLFCLFVALAFGGITYLSQKLSSRPPKYQKQHGKKPGENDQQKQMKTMMLVMNFMFVFMSLSSTSLGIYWLIGGIYQIGQSQLGRKINEAQYEKLQKKNYSANDDVIDADVKESKKTK